MAQNWSAIQYYIKSKLASNVNALELTDAEIQAIIKNITLPEFSTYHPKKQLYHLSMTTKIASSLNKYSFKIPIDVEQFTIVRVEEALYSTSDATTLLSGVSSGLLVNPVDIAMSAQSLDMRRSLQTIRTYKFQPPDTIIFNERVTSDLILDLALEHDSPITIQSDMYHRLFKYQAFRDVLDNVIMSRSKYSNLSTPLGQIELNVDSLIQVRDALTEKIQTAEENLPPDVLVTFL